MHVGEDRSPRKDCIAFADDGFVFKPSKRTKRHGIMEPDDVTGKIPGVLKQLVGEAAKP